jgi:hypothetical protein
MMAEQSVTKDACEARHEGIKENFERTERRLNDHSERIGSVEDAVLKLTILVESIGKKSLFDKILIIAVFIIAVVLLALLLGPEYVGKILGGALS